MFCCFENVMSSGLVIAIQEMKWAHNWGKAETDRMRTRNETSWCMKWRGCGIYGATISWHSYETEWPRLPTPQLHKFYKVRDHYAKCLERAPMRKRNARDSVIARRASSWDSAGTDRMTTRRKTSRCTSRSGWGINGNISSWHSYQTEWPLLPKPQWNKFTQVRDHYAKRLGRAPLKKAKRARERHRASHRQLGQRWHASHSHEIRWPPFTGWHQAARIRA